MRRPIVSKTIVAALAVGLAAPAVGAFPGSGRAATPLPASAVAPDALAMEWSGTVSWSNSEAFELAGSNTHETWTSQSSGSWQLEGSVVLDDSLPHDLRGSGATSVHAEYLFHMDGPCPGGATTPMDTQVVHDGQGSSSALSTSKLELTVSFAADNMLEYQVDVVRLLDIGTSITSTTHTVDQSCEGTVEVSDQSSTSTHPTLKGFWKGGPTTVSWTGTTSVKDPQITIVDSQANEGNGSSVWSIDLEGSPLACAAARAVPTLGGDRAAGVAAKGCLTADAGGPYVVRRAKPVRLDASMSKGRRKIASYEWQFTPGKSCPSGTKLINKTLTTTSPTVEIVVLCGLFVKLQVTDTRGKTANAKTRISVLRRGGSFKPTVVKLDEHAQKDPRVPTDEIHVAPIDWGVNVSGCRTDSSPLTLCPPVEDKARPKFDTATVDDKKGPFDGYAYVSHNHVAVPLKALLNVNMFPGSMHRYPDPKRPGKTITWLAMNLRKGAPVAENLQSTREHEGWGKGGSAASPMPSGHAGATQLALRKKPAKTDPALVLEAMFDTSRVDLVAGALKELRRIDTEVSTAAQDPLPQIWSGTLWFFDKTIPRWRQCSIVTGPKAPMICP